MSVVDVVRESRDRIDRVGGDVSLVFGTPIPRDEVLIAEELLGLSFPASYTELVTQLGPFKLADRWNARSRSFELLSPDRVLQETDTFRRAARTVDAETAALAEQFVLVQFDVSPVDFYVLRADGTVHFNAHDRAFSWEYGVPFDEHVRAVLLDIEGRVRLDVPS